MKWFITGGAGFIGINTAQRLLEDGEDVILFDNLSRPGSQPNVEWLQSLGDFELIRGDVRNRDDLAGALKSHPDTDVLLHLAAQVAVTCSTEDPRTDFEINALGTFNVCEAVRRFAPETILLNASTNKVYGGMEQTSIIESGGRYQYADLPSGVAESQPLDFHSPYGCSKGAGDQYVIDYARIYGLRTVTFRQSCIYGPRQFGVEDQGWVAWFAIAAVLGRPITLYGDGKQVRDILYVRDLVDCYIAAVQNIQSIRGKAYNVGGGPGNVASLLEVIGLLENILGRKLDLSFAGWRPGDQRVFVCDIRKAAKDFGWRPSVPFDQGIATLVEWVSQHQTLFATHRLTTSDPGQGVAVAPTRVVSMPID